MPVAVDGLKQCANPRCTREQPLPVTEFTRHAGARDGLQSYCKKCNSGYQSIRRREDPAFSRKRSWIYRKHKYGITEEDFMRMLEEQNHRCPICLVRVDASSSLDHCHDSGEIRGILCPACNVGIGHLRHHVPSLQRAIQYLENYH